MYWKIYRHLMILSLAFAAFTASAFAEQNSKSVPPGSCQPSSSMSVLRVGRQVFSFVPKGAWIPQGSEPRKDIGLVQVEPDPAPVKRIPTPKEVNSCASNSRTGQTVCTTNENDLYVFTGPFLTSTLTSSAVGQSLFFGGSCTTCGVTMDALHNAALMGISLSPTSGFQYVDLGHKPSVEPAFPSMAPPSFNPGGEISKGILIDPLRNWILSANESGNYEIIKIGNSNDNKNDKKNDKDDKDKDGRWISNDAKDDDGEDERTRGDRKRRAYFEKTVVHPVNGLVSFSSAGEDCSTMIAMGPVEDSHPSQVYLADLSRATFTPGSPGTWNAPSRFQELPESDFSTGPAGIAMAEDTHIGILTGMASDSVTAIKLQATSGSGSAPMIKDWVTCRIPNMAGIAPHTVNAYQSPNNDHAMAIVGDLPASTLWRIDLTKMLALSRNTQPHTCDSAFLPPAVIQTIAVP